MARNTTTPNPVYRPGQILVATVLLFVAVLTALVAVTNPLVVAGAGATTTLTAVVTTVTLDYRRKAGRTRRVCVPTTTVCVDA